MSDSCKQYPCVVLCRTLWVFTVVISLTSRSVFGELLSREVETFLKVDRDVLSQNVYSVYEQYDDTNSPGYSSLSHVFTQSGKNCSTDSDCRPWYFCQDHCCECGKDHNGIMLCDDKHYISAVLSCHCVTYDDTENATYVGACIYRCANEYNGDLFDPVYKEVQLNDSIHLNAGSWLNEFSCSLLNRKGRLCGSCLDNHSTIAYSYEMKCMECADSDILKNWIKYLFAAYSFLTVFYFIIFFFQVNITSSSLHGFVFYSQIVAMPTNIRFIVLTIAQKQHYNLPAKILLSIYGISNLDFFRMLYPPFCLNLSTLGNIALDYAIAVYPLVLVLISFVLMKLYLRNFKPIVFLWKPFHKLFTRIRRNWNVQTSVVDAYATLFLLSFSKVLNVTFDLLGPTTAYKLNPNEGVTVVYNDANINYFSHEHMLPYGLLGIVFLIFFVILPVMTLLLYPCRCCRACLKSTRLNSMCLLTFVNAFYACYKDGSESNTKDYRYFAAFYLMVRILLFIVYTITLGSIFFAFAAAIFLLFTLLIITVQPHKSEFSHYTKIDATFLLLLVIMCTVFLGINIATVKGHRHIEACFILAVIFGIVPFIYFGGVLVYTIHTQKKWDLQIISHYRAWRRGYRVIEDPDDDSSLPDRLLNPTSYADCSVQARAAGQSVATKSVLGTAY